MVTVAELVTLIIIALGATPVSACSQGVSQGESVDVALLIRAVGKALNGCGDAPQRGTGPFTYFMVHMSDQPLIRAIRTVRPTRLASVSAE